MPRYFLYPIVLLCVTFSAWGFGSRRLASADNVGSELENHGTANESANESDRSPAGETHERPVDTSGGGRGLAVLDSEQVANALAAEMRALGVTEQRHLGEHPACNDDNDTSCLMSLSPAERSPH